MGTRAWNDAEDTMKGEKKPDQSQYLKNQKKILGVLALTFVSFLLWSLVNPKDYSVWLLEVFPALIGVSILAITYNKFKFTTLVYIFVLAHSIILFIGGHYTYAENPLFDWIKSQFSLDRNYYDRLGHIMQGFVPALIIREFLLRKTRLEKGKMLFFIVICVTLAISATYEFFEWWTALLASPDTGNAFLAMQGDIWDTQWDMFLALLGGIGSLLMFSRMQDRQIKLI